MPKISVIMPAYNAEKLISEAIDSILCQTFSDFELIIIDDGSSDKTAEIIGNYNDSRICFYQNENNMGVAETLNKGLGLASGEYIARMDSDDIALPVRFEKQIAYLEKNKDVDVCGSNVIIFSESEEYISDVPIGNSDIRYNLYLCSPMFHPAVMMRKNSIDRFNLHYEKEFEGQEDYRLWMQFSLTGAKFYNIPEPLLKYRVHESQVTKKSVATNISKDMSIRNWFLQQNGILFTEREADAFGKYASGLALENLDEETALRNLFFKIAKKQNENIPDIYISVLFGLSAKKHKNKFKTFCLTKGFPFQKKWKWLLLCIKSIIKDVL